MLNFVKKYFFTILIVILVGINLFLIFNLTGVNFFQLKALVVNSKNLNKDLVNFQSQSFKTFKDLSFYFTQLAENKGAVYAFELLKIAPMLPNTDMHLLGHVVGDVLYKQEGVNGMYKCTQDFRNACSHTIVVGLLLDKGESALSLIADACKYAPGGSGAYTMCFHGLGHGVLAYNGYDLAKTVKMCQKTGNKEFNNRESSECVGGAIMEIISGGFHDRQAWEKQRLKFLSNVRPLEPCSLDIIPVEIKSVCYIYLTPHLFQVAGANLSKPDVKSMAKAFRYCDQIDIKEVSNRRVCFSGFGKEFIVLAKERDIRNMNSFTQSELQIVYRWCNLAVTAEGIQYCLEGAVSSLFWGGENNPQVSVDFCSLVDKQYKNNCFNILMGNAHGYLKSKDLLQNFCNLLPIPYKEICLQKSTSIIN